MNAAEIFKREQATFQWFGSAAVVMAARFGLIPASRDANGEFCFDAEAVRDVLARNPRFIEEFRERRAAMRQARDEAVTASRRRGAAHAVLSRLRRRATKFGRVVPVHPALHRDLRNAENEFVSADAAHGEAQGKADAARGLPETVTVLACEIPFQNWGAVEMTIRMDESA